MDKDSTQEISKDRIYDATATTGSLTPLPLDDITVAESVVQHDRDVLLSPKPQHNASVHAISSNPESRRNTPDYSSQGSSTVNSAPFASKRFSAVNINKKFLEKNSSAGSSLTTHSVQSNGTSKLGSSMAAYSQSAARPGFQSVSSHSKLVTTKLTTSAPAATPTPGWSRPSSVAPLASPSQSIPSGRGILSGAANSHNQVQLQNTNKNTQIQSQTTSTARFENPSQSSRPVWRNLAGGASRTTSGAQYDFPTAAEAARASLFKPSESRFPTDNVPLPNGNMLETAAAFRGAHLDPNAHHWDEMEEDDNDFLDAVIEFGDGTQYKVNVENQLSQKSPYMVDTVPEGSKSTDDRLLEVPISKEERLPDDFDRSWPPKPSYTSQSDETDKGQRMVNGSNSRFRTSLNDAAHTRVLFNERSNRMEIYGSGNNPWQNGSSTQSRGPPNNVQVLQKLDRLRIAETQDNEHLEVSKTAQRDKMRVEIENSGDESIVVDIPDSSREMSLNVIVSVNANEPEKSKETNDAQPHSPNLSLQSAASHTSNQFSAAEIPLSPSVPNSASSDPPRSYSSLSSRTAMTSALSVRSTVQSPQNGPDNVDVELLRKSYLHISAERAKERKRQEEEERLKAQERARQKALELEKKLQIVSPITSVSSDEIGLDNVAIAKVVTQSLHDVQKQEQRPDTSIIFDKTVSAIHNLDDKIISKQSHITRKSVGKGPVPSSGHPSSTHRQAALNGSVEEDLWRTGGSSSANSKYEMLVSQKNLEFGCLDVRPDEIVQILDFSDISQLVPAEDVSIHDDRKHSRATPYTATHSQPNDNASSSKNDIRRGQQEDSFTVGTDTIDGPEQGENQADSINAGVDRVNKLNDDGQQSMNRISGSSISASHITIPVWSNYPPHQDSALKSPRSTLYREVPMSALTDTMSRIKGAMHGLQTSNGLDASQDNVDVIADKQQHGRSIKEAKWLPPALRNFSALRSRETFITHPEPLFVSAPANHDVAVRLPKRSRRLERSPRKQYAHWKVPNKYPAISSRDFRIEGRMLSYIVLDTVLFQNPEIFNGGKPTYTVLLPASTSVRPRVNLPKSSFRGIMGTRGNADSVTWQLSQLENTTQVDEPKLRIISRSPPPQTLSTTITLSLKSKSDQALKILQSKAKAAHRSASADVAFYRDIRASSSSSNILASVKFTVLSELDEKGVKDRTIRAISASQKEDDIQGRVNIGDIPSTSGGEEVSGSSKFSGSQQSASETKGANLSSTVEKRGAEESVDPKKSTLTKPSLPTWGRGPLFHIEGSTADPPNSELLKAVWSQASDGDALPTVNSLKGFADDLSAVPFILHEVKSDDGGTPPPASSSQALSFSASDVARSFQTVPSSSKEDTSSSSSLSAPYFPAVPNTQTFLRHNGSMPRSPVAVPIGPQYGSYPSPMMSHSPSPTLLYTQQHNLGSMPSPQYGQPVWMPLSGAMQPHGSPPQYTAPYYHYTPAMGQPVYPTIQHAPRFYSNGMHQHIPLVSPPAAAPLAQPHPTAYTAASASSPLLRTTSQAPSNQGHNYPANVDLNKNYAPSHGHYTNHTPMAAPSPRTQIPSSYSTQSSNSRPSW